MAEEGNRETEEKPQRKLIDVDGFVSGVGKVFSIGEIPNDPVIKALKRFNSWLKHILVAEIMVSLVAGLPSYGVYKIRRGEVDDFAQTVVKVADIAFAEQADEPQKNVCPECGSGDIEIWDTTEDVWIWKCAQCGAEFNIE